MKGKKKTKGSSTTKNKALDFYKLHEECSNQCRSSILLRLIEENPNSLTIAKEGYLPLHLLLCNSSSSTDDALMMIEKYPAALQHQNIIMVTPLFISSASFNADQSSYRNVLNCIRGHWLWSMHGGIYHYIVTYKNFLLKLLISVCR
jgi:hypothetical protein